MARGSRVKHMIFGYGTVVGRNSYSVIVKFDGLDTNRTISLKRAFIVMKEVS